MASSCTPNFESNFREIGRSPIKNESCPNQSNQSTTCPNHDLGCPNHFGVWRQVVPQTLSPISGKSGGVQSKMKVVLISPIRVLPVPITISVVPIILGYGVKLYPKL